ncbi:uncharacterized protein LOC129596019 [Paramacrobiotus metropolitanus]|uniref:uncharacterized protein LOC129596019 n=1 Tax=Paramacrobiotus metropolitanus TaxID=2943436 RepID=UPI002445EDD3|nr:uncharacterized protein LOC129596019 [Paramacrobiotus metropolitanus]
MTFHARVYTVYVFWMVYVSFPSCECIIGGSDVESVQQHSFLVALVKRKSELHCGGTVISPWFVLTAAHCFCEEDEFIDTCPTTVVTAEHARIWSEKAFSHLQPVLNVYVHPEFSCKNFAYAIPNDDVALLELYTPLPVKPISLRSIPWEERASQRVELVGWGATVPGGKSMSTILRTVETEVVPPNECRDAVHAYQNLTSSPGRDGEVAGDDDHKTFADTLKYYEERQLCTKGFVNNHPADSAKGDSGGPVILRVPGQEPVLIGVISSSFNGTSGDRNSPGINVNITYYKEWIAGIIQASGGLDIFGMRNETLVDTAPVQHFVFYAIDWMKVLESVYAPISVLFLLAILAVPSKQQDIHFLSKQWWSKWLSVSAGGVTKSTLYYATAWIVLKLSAIYALCIKINPSFWEESGRLANLFVCFITEILVLAAKYASVKLLEKDKQIFHNNPNSGSRTWNVTSANHTIEEIDITSHRDKVIVYVDRLREFAAMFNDRSCQHVVMLKDEFLFKTAVLGQSILRFSTNKWNESMQFVPMGTKHALTDAGIANQPGKSVVIRYGSQILDGLAYLHTKGIVHGALDLTTVFVNDAHEIKIFGYLDSVQRNILGVTYKMDPVLWQAFMSPESLLDFKQPDAADRQAVPCKTDMWSFGCIMVYLLTDTFRYSFDRKHSRRNFRIKFIKNGKDCVVCSPGGVPEIVMAKGHLDYDAIDSPRLREILDKCFSFDPAYRNDASTVRQSPYFRVSALSGHT